MFSQDFNIKVDRPKGLTDPARRAAVFQTMREAAQDVINFAEYQATANAPARTGNLKRSIRGSKVKRYGNTFIGEVSVGVFYGKWVESGTGLHGPFGTPVRPRVANFMVWKEFNPMVRPGQEATVFARWTRGQKAQHYMRRAYLATERIYQPARLEVLGEQLRRILDR